MQLTLSADETEILTSTVKMRIDELLKGIAKADSREYRDMLIAEGKTLEEIYERMGCSHTEWSEAHSCDFQ